MVNNKTIFVDRDGNTVKQINGAINITSKHAYLEFAPEGKPEHWDYEIVRKKEYINIAGDHIIEYWVDIHQKIRGIKSFL